MSDTNCPNCGAPKQGAVCEYCGTRFQRYVGGTARRAYQGEATIEVEQETVTVYNWGGEVVCHIPLVQQQVYLTVNELKDTIYNK